MSSSRRKCGECNLCCRLLPVVEFSSITSLTKPAGERCPHQRHKKGCNVHNTRNMPNACQKWSCRWLLRLVPDDIPRPDRCGLVVDLAPDYIELTPDNKRIPVVQIWADPKRIPLNKTLSLPDEWGNFFKRLASQGWGVIIRPSGDEALVGIPVPGIKDGYYWLHSSDPNCYARAEMYGGEQFAQLCDAMKKIHTGTS